MNQPIVSMRDCLIYFETSLPFPVFRHILDYLGKCSFSNTTRQSLQSHFQHRICHKCGEYLDFPLKRLKTSNKKRRARHLTCRSRKFMNDSIFKSQRVDVHITDIFDPAFLESRPYTGMTPTECPILIRTKKKCPKFWSTMIFTENHENHRMISKCFFYPLEIRNRLCGNIMALEDDDFMVLSKGRSGTNHHQILRNNDDQLIYRDVNVHFQSHSIVDILEFFFQNIKRMDYKPEYFEIFEEIIQISPSNVVRQLLKKININHVAVLNHAWMKNILLEFPELLQTMKDEIITDFYNHHRKWFLSVLCVKRPITFKYISFQYMDQ